MSSQDSQEAIVVYRKLRRSINALKTTNYFGKSFIPDSDFDAVFTFEVLEECAHHLLKQVEPDDLDFLYCRLSSS